MEHGHIVAESRRSQAALTTVQWMPDTADLSSERADFAAE
jgi:hypothetical protein